MKATFFLISTSDEAIPFCNVYVVNSNKGTLTDEDGRFFIADLTSNDTITISRIGYETRTIIVNLVDNNIDSIVLPKSSYSLGEVVVESGKLKNLRTVKLGRQEKRTNHYLQGNTYSSYQIATKIISPSKEDGILESVSIYIGSLAKNKFPFRLNIYDIDVNCNCPGDRLNFSEIIVSKVRKGWNNYKFDQAIEFPINGIFVSYEWLAADGTNSLQLYRHKLGIITSSESNYSFEKIGGQKWKHHSLMASNNFHLLFRATARIVK
jgi:hypothetical protein